MKNFDGMNGIHRQLKSADYLMNWESNRNVKSKVSPVHFSSNDSEKIKFNYE